MLRTNIRNKVRWIVGIIAWLVAHQLLATPQAQPQFILTEAGMRNTGLSQNLRRAHAVGPNNSLILRTNKYGTVPSTHWINEDEYSIVADKPRTIVRISPADQSKRIGEKAIEALIAENGTAIYEEMGRNYRKYVYLPKDSYFQLTKLPIHRWLVIDQKNSVNLQLQTGVYKVEYSNEKGELVVKDAGAYIPIPVELKLELIPTQDISYKFVRISKPIADTLRINPGVHEILFETTDKGIVLETHLGPVFLRTGSFQPLIGCDVLLSQFR